VFYGDLSEQDKFALRSTCKDAYQAITPLIQISKTRLDTFMKNIDSASASQHYDLNRWLELEKEVDSFIDQYKHNPLFLETFSVWLAEMDSAFTNNDAVFDEKSRRLASVENTKKHSEQRPSFRRGLKKIGSGLGAVGTGVATVATIPLALVGLPFALFGGGFAPSGTNLGRVGAMLTIPTIAAFTQTDRLVSGALEHNLRLAGSYHESVKIRECIVRIQDKLAAATK
jgi:hypothetical protein